MAANGTGEADVGARFEVVAAGIVKTWVEAEESSDGGDFLLVDNALTGVAGLDFVRLARDWYTAKTTYMSFGT